MTSVVIVDDHEALREGLAALLSSHDIDVLGAAATVAAGRDSLLPQRRGLFSPHGTAAGVVANQCCEHEFQIVDAAGTAAGVVANQRRDHEFQPVDAGDRGVSTGRGRELDDGGAGTPPWPPSLAPNLAGGGAFDQVAQRGEVGIREWYAGDSNDE